MDYWATNATWESEHLRREVFFLPSDRDRLYGSLYVARELRSQLGLVICPPWGWEADRMYNGMHAFAHGIALQGGAALIFQWPGHGDSTGDIGEAGMNRLAQATGDAIAAARSHVPGLDWGLAGVRLGASAAALASASLDPRYLLLIQPVIDPEGFFSELLRLSKRAALARPELRLSLLGLTISEEVLRAAAAAPVAEMLRAFRGDGAVACYRESPIEGLPDHFPTIEVAGSWKRNLRREHRALFRAALRGIPAPARQPT